MKLLAISLLIGLASISLIFSIYDSVCLTRQKKSHTKKEQKKLQDIFNRYSIH